MTHEVCRWKGRREATASGLKSAVVRRRSALGSQPPLWLPPRCGAPKPSTQTRVTADPTLRPERVARPDPVCYFCGMTSERISILVLALTLAVLPACGDDPADGDANDTSELIDLTGDSQDSDAAENDAADTPADAAPDVSDGDDAATGNDGEDATDAPDGDVTADTITPDPRYRFAIVDRPAVVDITPDGAIALFWDSASTTGDVWLYGVENGSLDLATSVGDPLRNFPTGMSDDLRITALFGQPVQAGIWNGTSWERIASPLPDGCGLEPEFPEYGDLGAAWDVSADGLAVVGLFWEGCTTVAFAAVEGESGRDVQLLERLGERYEGATLDPVNRATVVSDDGKVAAGFAQTATVDRWPAIWNVADRSGELLEAGDTYPADAPGEVLSISADGSVVAGTWNQRGFIWSSTGGLMDIGGFPELLPGEPTFVNALSADGKLAFGGSGGGFFGVSQAFVWSADKGFRKVRDLANAGGLNIPEDVILQSIYAISTDGTVLVGSLIDPMFQSKSFVLKLPASAFE